MQLKHITKHNKYTEKQDIIKKLPIVVTNKMFRLLLQFSCIMQTIDIISGKTANLTSNNQIELTFFGIFYHLQKVRSFLRLRSRNTFIYIFA